MSTRIKPSAIRSAARSLPNTYGSQASTRARGPLQPTSTRFATHCPGQDGQDSQRATPASRFRGDWLNRGTNASTKHLTDWQSRGWSAQAPVPSSFEAQGHSGDVPSHSHGWAPGLTPSEPNRAPTIHTPSKSPEVLSQIAADSRTMASAILATANPGTGLNPDTINALLNKYGLEVSTLGTQEAYIKADESQRSKNRKLLQELSEVTASNDKRGKIISALLGKLTETRYDLSLASRDLASAEDRIDRMKSEHYWMAVGEEGEIEKELLEGNVALSDDNSMFASSLRKAKKSGWEALLKHMSKMEEEEKAAKSRKSRIGSEKAAMSRKSRMGSDDPAFKECDCSDCRSSVPSMPTAARAA